MKQNIFKAIVCTLLTVVLIVASAISSYADVTSNPVFTGYYLGTRYSIRNSLSITSSGAKGTTYVVPIDNTPAAGNYGAQTFLCNQSTGSVYQSSLYIPANVVSYVSVSTSRISVYGMYYTFGYGYFRTSSSSQTYDTVWGENTGYATYNSNNANANVMTINEASKLSNIRDENPIKVKAVGINNTEGYVYYSDLIPDYSKENPIDTFISRSDGEGKHIPVYDSNDNVIDYFYISFVTSK